MLAPRGTGEMRRFAMRARALIMQRAERLLTIAERGVSEKNKLSIGVKNK